MEEQDSPNRIHQAARMLGLSRKDVDKATLLLNMLVTARKARRKKDYDPAIKTLEGFFQYALPQARDANAQLFQDLWVLYEFNDKRNGYFVEFGATNGITMSNSHFLEKHCGWQGIAAEPNPNYHERLGRERDCIISHKCVYSRSGERMKFLCTEKPILSRLEAINPEDSHEEQGKRAIAEEVMVETISLNDLLDEHGAPDLIDYISVDTEGSELEILSHFDFSRRRVNAFSIEHNFTPMRERIHELMTKHGYVRRFPEFTRFDDWYLHRDFL